MRLLLIFLFLISLLNGYSQSVNNFNATELIEGSENQMAQTSVSFILANTSNKSIPLMIPNVMNPNLSPNSESGVSLKYGQQILFRYKGKKRVLLTVDASIGKGEKLDVRSLLDERIREIDTK